MKPLYLQHESVFPVNLSTPKIFNTTKCFAKSLLKNKVEKQEFLDLDFKSWNCFQHDNNEHKTQC